MEIALSIGGYVIRIREPHDYPRLAWPLRPFEAFLEAPDTPPDLQVEVSVVYPLPELDTTRLRFDSAHGLWKLFESSDGLVLESLDTKTLQPRARALLSNDYRSARAWILPDLQGGQVGWGPMYLFNPIIEVCLLSLLAREGGLLLHAAGMTHDDHGYVFTGASGTGKSTIAQFFADHGAFILSDERVILRSQGTSTVLYGTPWVGSGGYAANASTPVTALYCISHGRERHEMNLLPPSKTVPLLLQQAFLPYWDRIGMETTLDFLVSLTEQIPCYSLAFLKQADVVDLVRHRGPSPQSSSLHKGRGQSTSLENTGLIATNP